MNAVTFATIDLDNPGDSYGSTFYSEDQNGLYIRVYDFLGGWQIIPRMNMQNGSETELLNLVPFCPSMSLSRTYEIFDPPLVTLQYPVNESREWNYNSSWNKK